MEHDAKLKAALERLAQTGLWPSSYAPPIYRFFWRYGIKLPPPHFSSFLLNFMITFVWSFGFFKLLNSGFDLSGQELRQAFSFGILLSLFMAAYYSFGAYTHGLPRWSEFKPGADPRRIPVRTT